MAPQSQQLFHNSERQHGQRGRRCLLITFVHANDFVCYDRLFVAHWIAWFETFGPTNEDPLTAPMPRYASHQSLAVQVASGRQFSVDVLARSLVPTQYRDTCQASQQFVAVNASVVEPCLAIGVRTGRSVDGLRLTDQARKEWAVLTADETAMETLRASAIIEADIDVDGDIAPPVLLGQNEAPITSRIYCSPVSSRASLVSELVSWIHSDPFQPHYRLRPYGRMVTGWPDRLRSYFWPVPTRGYTETAAQTSSFAERAALLAAAILEARDWIEAENAAAIQLADDIFTWGGVTQSMVTAEKVRAVFENAIAGAIVHARAPMNSGWTKLAAFASAHLEADCRAQVIWDSRVSTSVIERLDALLSGAGFAEPGALFPEIGLIPGRGGFRAERQDALRLHWPNRYRSWSTQLAASSLIGEIREVLNGHPDRFGQMPASVGDDASAWTVRGVEMVLFMDGY